MKDYLSVLPFQDNCYGDAAGFQVKIKSKVDEQEMRLKNTEIDEPLVEDSCLDNFRFPSFRCMMEFLMRLESIQIDL